LISRTFHLMFNKPMNSDSLFLLLQLPLINILFPIPLNLTVLATLFIQVGLWSICLTWLAYFTQYNISILCSISSTLYHMSAFLSLLRLKSNLCIYMYTHVYIHICHICLYFHHIKCFKILMLMWFNIFFKYLDYRILKNI
jgi:hypothetical protein